MSFADVIEQSQRALALLEDQQNPHSPARFISITRARCIARYRMQSVAGRPEELQRIGQPISARAIPEAEVPFSRTLDRVISFGYSGGELRIRKHGGPSNRTWIGHIDIRLTDGWLDKVYEFLDEWMGYLPASDRPAFNHPNTGEPLGTGNHGPGQPRPRPIKDNPQA